MLESESSLFCSLFPVSYTHLVVSGAGNVAIYAIEKCQQLGAKVVTCSDSTGWVYDPEGIDLAALKEIKEVKRARLTEYKKYRPNSEYHEGRGVWSVKCDIALPCACLLYTSHQSKFLKILFRFGHNYTI